MWINMVRVSPAKLIACLAVSAACAGAVVLQGREVLSPVAGVAVLDCPEGRATREPLSRMSKAEFARTVRDLIGGDVADVLPALAGLVAGIPDDDMQGGFANINWSLSADHVSGYLGVANEIGVQLTIQDALRRKILPCASDLNRLATSCIESLLNTFVTRAYRRPLDKSERRDLLRFYSEQRAKAPAHALSALITRVLISPSFLFKQGAGPVRTGADCAQRRIDESFERASRMAYGVWGTMPDAALFAAAKAQTLLDDDKLTTEIRRMLLDDKARQWVRTFFRQWLHYQQPPVEGYSWPFLGTIDRAHLHDHAAEELDRFIDAIVWTDRGSYRDLMTSRKVFTNAPAIRQIYGLPAEPTGAVEQAPADRAGILTRVALLAQGFDEASVVKRGAMMRRQLLCDPLSPPDPSILPAGSLVPPEKDYRLTTRQRWEARTAPPICQGCHRMINPLGFALEAFDGIGRARRVEKQPIPNSSPEAFTELAIDTAVIPFIESRTESVIDGPVALSAFLGDSKKANLCFVKQLTKFVSGHPVDGTDLTPLQGLADAMRQPGGSIQDVLAEIVKLHTLRK